MKDAVEVLASGRTLAQEQGIPQEVGDAIACLAEAELEAGRVDTARAILEGLEMEVSPEWDVTVPTWRARDVTREADLIEEVARAVLDRVPFTKPLRRHVRGRLSKELRLRRPGGDVVLVGCAPISIRPSGGVNLTAFSSRFVNTR